MIVLWYGPFPFTLLLLAFFSSLVILALIDWDHQFLPDVITLPGIRAGIAGSFLPGALVEWREAALAAAFGYVAFFLVAEVYARLRGIEGLGQGDWKLAAMMGAFLGGQRLMLTIFLGSISGMIYGLVQGFRLARSEPSAAPPQEATVLAATAVQAPSAALETAPEPPAPAPVEPAGDAGAEESVSIGKYKLPFGTFLAASAIFVLFAGDSVLLWYASLFRF